jgi:hypothetical protein
VARTVLPCSLLTSTVRSATKCDGECLLNPVGATRGAGRRMVGTSSSILTGGLKQQSNLLLDYGELGKKKRTPPDAKVGGGSPTPNCEIPTCGIIHGKYRCATLMNSRFNGRDLLYSVWSTLYRRGTSVQYCTVQ